MTMKAFAVARDDSPAIELVEVDEPSPGPDRAIIAVEAFSLNRGETFLLEREGAGWRPGKDVAGSVLLATADGTGPAVGARVVAHVDGAGWAEKVAVPAGRLAELPDNVSGAEAATLPLAGLTALRLLRVLGPLYGRTVLLTGASGGVGHFFVELAAAQGARVTAVASSEERGRRLLELGAHGIGTDVERARGPFDVGLDSVGGTSTQAVLQRLTAAGTLVWFGQASRRPPTLDFFDWTGGSSATIRKFHYLDGSDDIAADLATLVDLTAAGRLTPEIGFLGDWSRTDEAIEELLARRLRGKAVLTVESRVGGPR
jgi:NADPH:quinone reductase-like Zn-dependent oxidoreductase